eukprot:Seg8680.2 transcript_id=Seg8680.2/GoldUCD/mRNA.D3Y31 product="E3 ubiquitin-protein ligase rpm-1" protein_id=Seg8680.2/GoldUCD/D3Y31
MTITTNACTLEPNYTFGEPNSGPVSTSFRVSFEKPIEILANQKVNVSVVLSGPDTYRFWHRAKELFEIDGFQCRFSTASNSDNGTDIKHGQFPALFFEV